MKFENGIRVWEWQENSVTTEYKYRDQICVKGYVPRVETELITIFGNILNNIWKE